MKTKDLLALALLGVVLVVLGSFLISRLGGESKQRAANVEVVQPIDPTFNDTAREILLGRDQRFEVDSFSAPLNIRQGFGNSNPFRPE